MNTFKFALLILVCFAFGCQKEEQPTGCDLEIDLGSFPLSEQAKAVFSYSGHQYIPLYNIDKTDTIHLNINDPEMLEQELIWRKGSSDCGRGPYDIYLQDYIYTTNNYVYTQEEKLMVISLDIKGWDKSPAYLLRLASVFEESEEDYKKINESLFWYEGISILNQDEPWRLERTWRLNLPLFTDEEDEINETYVFYPELTLNGKGYMNVYVSTGLSGIYNTFYFTLEEGIIGIQEMYGEVYTLDQD